MGIRDCEPVMNLLNELEKPLRSSVVEFLKAQQCGLLNGIPKVCCGPFPKNLTTKLKQTSDQIYSRLKINTVTKRISEEEKRRREEILNRVLILDHLDDGFDLFRRRKRDKNDQLDIEIR